MELRSSLNDMGYPIEKNEGNPMDVTCPKVPLRLRENPRSKDYFDPTAISFGPYHHGERELQEIGTIKTEVMLKFIKESDKSFPEFYYKVRNMNHLTRACYVDCLEEKYCDDTFALIMLRDGCFISYLLDIVEDKKWDKVLELFVNHGKLLGIASVIKDMLLLENQIPLAVLELLMSLRYNNKKVVPKMINKFIYEFLGISLKEVPEDMNVEFLGISPEEVPKDINEEPQDHCLLECIQKEFSKVVDRKKEHSLCFNKEPEAYPSFRSVSELKAMGIHCKPTNSGHPLKKRISFSIFDIEFIPGFFYSQLKLPPLVLDHASVILWNNLIAFELSPACKTDIVFVAYFSFLNALIANTDDVKELRSKRIILNFAGSDEEMFKFFKEIYTGTIRGEGIYRYVREDIEKHCRSKIGPWADEVIYKYFRNPWSALGLFAAIAAIVLSFLQTYFTIYPVKD